MRWTRLSQRAQAAPQWRRLTGSGCVRPTSRAGRGPSLRRSRPPRSAPQRDPPRRANPCCSAAWPKLCRTPARMRQISTQRGVRLWPTLCASACIRCWGVAAATRWMTARDSLKWAWIHSWPLNSRGSWRQLWGNRSHRPLPSTTRTSPRSPASCWRRCSRQPQTLLPSVATKQTAVAGAVKANGHAHAPERPAYANDDLSEDELAARIAAKLNRLK